MTDQRPPISVRLRDDIEHALNKRAAQTGISRNAMINYALALMLGIRFDVLAAQDKRRAGK